MPSRRSSATTSQPSFFDRHDIDDKKIKLGRPCPPQTCFAIVRKLDGEPASRNSLARKGRCFLLVLDHKQFHSIECTTPFLGWNANSLWLQSSAHTSENVHIDVHRLIRDYRERSRRRAHMFGHAILNIQNIIPRRQPYSIVSFLIHCHPRNFFLFLLTKDDQRILIVGLGRTLRAWHLIRFSHRHTEYDFQMALQETLLCGVDPRAACKQKNNEGRDDVSKEDRPEHKKIGGIDFNLSRLIRKPTLRALSSDDGHCGRASRRRARG